LIVEVGEGHFEPFRLGFTSAGAGGPLDTVTSGLKWAGKAGWSGCWKPLRTL